jgi:hypothetical protein
LTHIKIRKMQKINTEVISMAKKYNLMIKLIAASAAFMLLFSGCAARQGEYPGKPGTPQARVGEEQIPGQTPRDNMNLLGGDKTMDQQNGMGQNQQDGVNQNQQDMLGQTPQTGDNYQPGMQAGMMDDRQRTLSIKKQLETMNGIKNVKVACSGDDAVVAYEPAATESDRDALNRTIVQKVKSMDRNIKNCTASDDPNMRAKVGQLYTDIVNNKPMSEVSGEVQKLMSSIKPAS